MAGILRFIMDRMIWNDPPTVLLHVNDPKLAHFTYLRYLRIKSGKHPYLGTPIRILLSEQADRNPVPFLSRKQLIDRI